MEPTPPLALQLWTVRDQFDRDPYLTLEAVAAMGYTAVEFAGFGNLPAQALRGSLDRFGLQAISAHIPFADLTTDLSPVLADAATLGCRRLVLPYIPPEQRATPAAITHLAETCNQLGSALAAAGMAFSYHNEDYDFGPIEGASLWERLLAQTDPLFVEVQFDLCSALLAGADPLELMAAHSRRITSLHLCDLRGRSYVPIGSGELDWPALLTAACGTATTWLIIEQDGSPEPLIDAARSMAGLTALLTAQR